MKSLREFINTKLDENNITIFELSKACGFGKDTFSKFMKDKDSKAVMSTPAVEAIASYFKVSLDEIIGRNDSDDKQINGSDSAIITSDKTGFLKKFNKKDLESIEAIKEANIISTPSESKMNIPNIKSQKSRSK